MGRKKVDVDAINKMNSGVLEINEKNLSVLVGKKVVSVTDSSILFEDGYEVSLYYYECCITKGEPNV